MNMACIKNIGQRARLLTIINLIYLLICFAGFLWQITEISLLFFAYDVTTHVIYDMPIRIKPPAMTLCHRYYDILDFDAMNKMRTDKHRESNSWNSEMIREVQSALSINEVLTLTPHHDETINACSFRQPLSYELFEKSKSDCMKDFAVHKFFTLEYVCYRYRFRNQSKEFKFTFHEIANTPAAPGQLYEFDLSAPFWNVTISKFLMHPAHRYPYKELEYSTVISSTHDFDKVSNATGRYKMSYYALETKRLPPPFVTNCIDYRKYRDGREGKTDCHQRCVKDQTMAAYGKIPFSSIESEKRNQSVLSYNDVQNLSIVDELFSMYNKCDHECYRYDCHEYIYFTRASYKPREYNLAFDAYLPFEPSINVVSKEQLTFAQFASIILSTFGTWFGISVIMLNPCRSIQSIKSIECKARTDSLPETDGQVKEASTDFRSRLLSTIYRPRVHFKNETSNELIVARLKKEQDLLLKRQVVLLTARVRSIETAVNNRRQIMYQKSLNE